MHHQIVVIAMAGIARCASLRNGTGGSPNEARTLAIKPPSGIRTMRQISVTIVTDSTDEEKNSPRRTAEKRDASLSASASASASMVSAGTVSRTNKQVFHTDLRNTPSRNR